MSAPARPARSPGVLGGALPLLPADLRGSLSSWLVPWGGAVVEGAPLAALTSLPSGRALPPLLSPVSGLLLPPTPAAAATAAECGTLPAGTPTDAPLAFLSFCVHDAPLFQHNLCVKCGVDVTKQPRRTKEVIAACVAAKAGGGGGGGGGKHSEGDGLTRVRVVHGFELSVNAAALTAADTTLQKRLLDSRKLTLVLDLDHTLIHTTGHPGAADYVAAHSTAPWAGDIRSFQDVSGGTYTVKLRPGVAQFLASAAELFALQIDTKGTRPYALSVAGLLDPEKKYFSPERIVSRCDTTDTHKSSSAWLHRSLGDDAMVLILDDTEVVWRGASNVVHIEPYEFWGEGDVHNAAGNRVGSGGWGTPLAPPPPKPAGLTASEDPHDYLADVLRVLRAVHAAYYAALESVPPPPTLRTDALLAAHISTLLSGTCLVFSGVFPLGSDPCAHPMWRRAVRFGALCALDAGASAPYTGAPDPPTSGPPIVTHLVARVPDTQKVVAAQAPGGPRIVTLRWLEDCLRGYSRQPEAGYAMSPALASVAVRDIAPREAALRAWVKATSEAAATAAAAQEESERLARQRREEWVTADAGATSGADGLGDVLYGERAQKRARRGGGGDGSDGGGSGGGEEEAEAPEGSLSSGSAFGDELDAAWASAGTGSEAPPLPPPYTIVPAGVDDLDRLREFVTSTHVDASSYSPESRAAQVADLPADFPDLYITQESWAGRAAPRGFLAVDPDGVILGAAGLKPSCSLPPPHQDLSYLFVAPGWRGRGMGKALLTTALAAAPPGLPVRLLSVTSYAEAISLYTAFGFVRYTPDVPTPEGHYMLVHMERGGGV